MISMGFSKYLDSKRSEIKQLVAELGKNFSYVSVLGVDTKATDYHVDLNTSNINPGSDKECGFVIKLSNGREFYEYSLDDITGDIAALAGEIVSSLTLSETLKGNTNLSFLYLVYPFCPPTFFPISSDTAFITITRRRSTTAVA